MKSNFPFIPQKSHDGCAVAVLTMICNYFGLAIKYVEVESTIHQKNLSFKEVIIFLSKKHFKATAYQLVSKDISLITKFPVILHYQNHYVIAYGKDQDLFIIADPAAFGVKKIHFLKIKKQWSGYYLDVSQNNIKPVEEIEKHLPFNVRLLILNLLILITIFIIFS